VLLTESMNLPIRDAGSKDFVFQKLLESGKSPTLEHRSVRLQVVSQPAWYAVMALPYLMEFPHECAEQTFHRYYANALARHLATSNPKIRRVFEQWQATKGIDSPLTKNSDLTGIMLEETPWLAEAADPAQARHQLGLLFDANRLDHELDLALRKLREMQRSDGLWPWFPGGPGDSHITLGIATGFARLRASGVATDVTPALKALTKLDADLTARFTELRKQNQQAANHLDAAIAEYLYTRTLFLKDRQPDRADQAAFDFFTGQAKRHWAKLGSRLSRPHVAPPPARPGATAHPQPIPRPPQEPPLNPPSTPPRGQHATRAGQRRRHRHRQTHHPLAQGTLGQPRGHRHVLGRSRGRLELVLVASPGRDTGDDDRGFPRNRPRWPGCRSLPNLAHRPKAGPRLAQHHRHRRCHPRPAHGRQGLVG